MKKIIICLLIACLGIIPTACTQKNGENVATQKNREYVIAQKNGEDVATQKNGEDAIIKNISGKILFKSPMSSGDTQEYAGLVLLDPLTKEIVSIDIHAGRAKFMGNTSKILADVAGGVATIDLQSGETNIVCTTFDALSVSAISYVNEEYISVTDQYKLYLVNIHDGSNRVLVDSVTGIHSWSGDGKLLYYSSGLGEDIAIYVLNLETGEDTYVCKGLNPNVSRDGTKLMYRPDRETREIVVKDLVTGKEWRYNNATVRSCFSPDGEYVAIVEYWRGSGYYLGYSVVIWDYKLDITQVVVPKYANGQCFDIDWAE